MNIYINGMASPMKNATFDGVTELNPGTNAVFVNPSMDAVSEVRVLTNAFQAEYGRTSGGTINMIIKSGSRDFHGSAFWQHRHEDMNANTFFNNRTGVPRPLYRYFIGGGTIGNLVRAAYPGLGSINYQCNCLSDLNYHGLQVSASHRMSHGLQFGVSYVFSKALGTQGSDPYHIDRQWFYRPLAQDRSHVLNVNWVYQIPTDSNQIAKHILNNWMLSGIAAAQTGAPMSPSCPAVTGPVSVTDPTLTGATNLSTTYGQFTGTMPARVLSTTLRFESRMGVRDAETIVLSYDSLAFCSGLRQAGGAQGQHLRLAGHSLPHGPFPGTRPGVCRPRGRDHRRTDSRPVASGAGRCGVQRHSLRGTAGG
jgi:hypothetical protein